MSCSALPCPVPLRIYEKAARICDDCILRQISLPTSPAELSTVGLSDSITPETLNSIYRQRYQVFIRRTAHLHRHPDALAMMMDAYTSGVSIIEIARRPDVNFSPYLLARVLIEHILDVSTSRLRDMVKSPSLIGDDRLRSELAAAIAFDQQCSPAIDKLRAAIGDAHEVMLSRLLRARGIPFADEEELRCVVASAACFCFSVLLEAPRPLRWQRGAPSYIR